MNTHTKILENYKNISISSINCYGYHLSFIEGIKGRLSCILHWHSEYNEKELTRYLIECSTANPNIKIDSSVLTDNALRNTLNAIKEFKLNFNEISPREAAYLALAFKNKQKQNLEKIFNLYKSLKKNGTLNCDIATFISIVQKDLKDTNLQSKLEAAFQKPTYIQELVNSLKINIGENLIYDSSGALSAYLYTLVPILNTTFKALTFNLLYESFGVFLAYGIIAELAVILVNGLHRGVSNYQNLGISCVLKGLQEEWKKRIADDNSFHPIIEILATSILIASIWLTTDKIEQAATAIPYLYTFAQYGIKNYCLKYAVLYSYFTIKAQMHQSDFNISSIPKAFLAAIIRGICKNFLMSIPSQWKLSIASNLASYTPFLSETYLKEWWIKDIISKTFIASTPLWVLKETPIKLISALYFAQEVLEILVNAISKTLEIISISLLWSIPYKAYEYLYPKPNIAN